MNASWRLTWQIVRKDLRLLRSSLLLLAAVIALKLACGALLIWHPQAGESFFAEAMVGVANLAIFLEVLLTWFVVPRLVHEDRLAGAAFWQTRPIGAARLWRAKAVTASLGLAAMPVLLTLPWWIACGLGPRDIVFAAGETVLWQMLVVALAVGPAALSADLKQFLLAILVLVLAVVLMPQAALRGFFDPYGRPLELMDTLADRPFDVMNLIAANAGPAYTRLGLAFAVVLAGSIGVGWHQYRTQAIHRSLGLALGALGLAAALSAWWPWDGLRLFAPDEGGRLARGMKLEFRDALLDEPLLWTRLQATGAPAGHRMVVRGYHHWDWPDGRNLSVNDGGFASLDPDLADFLGLAPLEPAAKTRQLVLRHVLGPADWTNPGIERTMAASGAERPGATSRPMNLVSRPLPRHWMTSFRAGPARHRVEVWGTVERPMKGGEVPLRRAAVLSQASGVSRVESVVESSDHSFAVLVADHRAALAWDDVRLARLGLALEENVGSVFWLVDRGQRRAVRGAAGLPGLRVRVAGVAIRRRSYLFRAAELQRAREGTAGPDWREGLSLARVDFQVVERFRQVVATERFGVGTKDLLYAVGDNGGESGSVTVPSWLLTGTGLGDAEAARRAIGEVAVRGEVAADGRKVSISAPQRSVPYVLRQAAGLLETADTSHVRVLRKGATLTVDLEAYLQGTVPLAGLPPLEDGDTVEVPRR